MISFDVASTVANSFLILIFISPVSLRWHLARSRRVWAEDFSILTPWPCSSSSSSLNHWILIGSFPENGSLKEAFSPAFTITGSENLLKVSTSIFGGSEEREKWICNCFTINQGRVVKVLFIRRQEWTSTQQCHFYGSGYSFNEGIKHYIKTEYHLRCLSNSTCERLSPDIFSNHLPPTHIAHCLLVWIIDYGSSRIRCILLPVWCWTTYLEQLM